MRFRNMKAIQRQAEYLFMKFIASARIYKGVINSLGNVEWF